MDISGLAEYFDIVIVGICLCIGYIIKNAIPNEKVNKFIPLVVGLLGMILAIISHLDSISLKVVLTGLFSGLASTGLYETFKNLINKK